MATLLQFASSRSPLWHSEMALVGELWSRNWPLTALTQGCVNVQLRVYSGVSQGLCVLGKSPRQVCAFFFVLFSSRQTERLEEQVKPWRGHAHSASVSPICRLPGPCFSMWSLCSSALRPSQLSGKAQITFLLQVVGAVVPVVRLREAGRADPTGGSLSGSPNLI